MQRYHRATLCWEGEVPIEGVCIPQFLQGGHQAYPGIGHLSGSETSQPMAGDQNGMSQINDGTLRPPLPLPIPPSEWSKSSRGAWYLTFPLPDDMSLVPAPWYDC